MSLEVPGKDDLLYGFAYRGIGLCPECWLNRGFRKMAVCWDATAGGGYTQGAERDGWTSIVGEIQFAAAYVHGVKTCIECRRTLEDCARQLPGVIVHTAWSADRVIEGFLVSHEGYELQGEKTT